MGLQYFVLTTGYTADILSRPTTRFIAYIGWPSAVETTAATLSTIKRFKSKLVALTYV